MKIELSSFKNNFSAKGGVIFVDSSSSIADLSITNNIFGENYAQIGAVLFSDSNEYFKPITLSNSIYGNVAY